MNTSTLPYFAWKEVRQLRPILLVLGLFIVLSVLAYHALGENALPFASVDWVWYFSAVFCALSGLVIGVTTFSIEKETSTFDFLSNLPISTSQLVSGKLLPRLVATTLFAIAVLVGLGFTCLSTQSFAKDLSGISMTARLSKLSLLIVLPTVELFVWGALFSTLTNRTLIATILAAFTGSLFVQLAHGFITPDLINTDTAYRVYTANWERRVVIVLAVLILDLVFAARWASNRAERSTRFRLPRIRDSWPKQLTTQIPMVKLTWQTLRQSGWALAISVLLVIGLLAITPGLLLLSANAFYTSVMPWIAITFAIMGLSVFWDDQRKNAYQFFQQHAEYGRSVWLVRMLVWLTLFAVSFLSLQLLCSLVTSVYFTGNVSAHYLADDDSIVYAYNWIPLLVWCLGCFAIGAYFSMFCRSLILAPVFALISVGVYSGWVYLVFEMFIGFWWSVLPIVLSLFLAMFLHSPKWISDTQRTRAFASYSLMHSLVIATVLMGVAFYRYHEIKESFTVEVLPTEARWKRDDTGMPTETVEEYNERMRRDYPELSRFQNSTRQIIFQDEFDAAIQARTTILLAAEKVTKNWPKATTAEKIDIIKLENWSDKQLRSVLDENRESLDLLASLPDSPQIVPSFANSKSESRNLCYLMLAKAESELREGKLVESIQTHKSLAWILSQAFYSRKRADINLMLDFFDRWVDHPDHTLESYSEGKNVRYIRQYSTIYACIVLKTKTDLELARRSGRSGLSPFFFERERNRRLDEANFIQSYPQSENQWLARSLPIAQSESNPVYRKQIRSSPDRPGPTWLSYQGFRSQIQQLKLDLKYLKLKTGRFPINITSRNDFPNRRGDDWEYRNEGLEYDAYIWDGDQVKLLVEKNKAFFLHAPSSSIHYEKWGGIPNPRLADHFIVLMKDGRQFESEHLPRETSDADSTPMYGLSVSGEPMQIPVSSVDKIVHARDLTGDEPTYLIHRDVDADLKATILE